MLVMCLLAAVGGPSGRRGVPFTWRGGRSADLFQFLEGSDEAVIGVNDLPPGFDKIIGLGIGHALVLDEVAEHEGN
jgi:hypothetical protein